MLTISGFLLATFGAGFLFMWDGLSFCGVALVIALFGNQGCSASSRAFLLCLAIAIYPYRKELAEAVRQLH